MVRRVLLFMNVVAVVGALVLVLGASGATSAAVGAGGAQAAGGALHPSFGVGGVATGVLGQGNAVFGVPGSIRSVPGSAPTTLVRVPDVIEAFAQDGHELVWYTGCNVWVRPAGGGRAALVGEAAGGDACYLLDVLALGGTRALWGGFEDCCNYGMGSVDTGIPGAKARELVEIGQDHGGWGDYLSGGGGDGDTLVYSLVRIDFSPGKEEAPSPEGGLHCLPDDPCTWDVTGGGVWRVVGAKAEPVPGTPPTALLAATAGRIALVAAERGRFPGPCEYPRYAGCPEVRTGVGARVEIRNAVSGTRTASFVPRGRVTALAIDAETAAVIVRSGGKTRVEWYSADSGRRLGAAAVAAGVEDTVDVSGRVLVLQRGRSILTLDTFTRRLRVLAKTASEPIGVSIEGTRVAWAENVGGHGLVRAIKAH